MPQSLVTFVDTKPKEGVNCRKSSLLISQSNTHKHISSLLDWEYDERPKIKSVYQKGTFAQMFFESRFEK